MGANKKITELTSGSALDGTEELPIVQGGSTVKTTLNAIATFSDQNLNDVVTVGNEITTSDNNISFYIKKASTAIKSIALGVFSGAGWMSFRNSSNSETVIISGDGSGSITKNGNEVIVGSTLTTNYIPKATASDTIGNSQIVDDGSFVGIAEPSPTARLSVLTPDNLVSSFGVKIRQNVSGDDLFTIKGNGDSSFTNKTRLGVGDFVSSTARLGVQGISGASSTDYIFITYPYGGAYIPFAVQENGKILLQGLTASQIVATDSSKNLQSLDTATYPSLTELSYVKGLTSAAQTQLDSKLTASNNLSDLSNPLTARNNLKEWALIMTTGDQSTTSNASSNITDLVSPTLTINKRYQIHGRIRNGCNNTGGIKYQITLPAGASMYVYFSGSNTSNTTYTNAFVNASATLMTVVVQAFNGSSVTRVDGEITMGATAGTIQFGFASGTNTQTSTVYQQGTSITLKQLD